MARNGSIEKENKMAYKLLGEIVDDPTDEDFGGVTLVYILANGADTVRLEKADGNTVIGTMKLAAGQSIRLTKDATDKVTCTNSSCTPIAYHW